MTPCISFSKLEENFTVIEMYTTQNVYQKKLANVGGFQAKQRKKAK
jgi:hypothetical protein